MSSDTPMLGTEPLTIGEHIDALGMEATLDPSDQITFALVVLEVADSQGCRRLVVASRPGMSPGEQMGLLYLAEGEVSRKAQVFRHGQ